MMIEVRPMIDNPVEYLDCWVSFFACSLTYFSCGLALNHMPRKTHWREKLLHACVGVFAFAIAWSPFFGYNLTPDIFEVGFHVAVSAFAAWATWPYWREIPWLNRRLRRRREGEEKHKTEDRPCYR